MFLARLTAGIYGGLAGGVAVGAAEALVVLSTAAHASEYQALFAAVLVYGAVGLGLGLGLGLLLAVLGFVWKLTEAGAYTVSLWASSVLLVGQGLTLWLADRFGDAVPTTWWAGVCGLLALQTLLVAWLGPILLTRTPLKVLLRPHGNLAALVAALGVSAIFSFAPGRHGAGAGLPAPWQQGRLADRPNVLLVVVQGLRADRAMRSMDRVASEGVTYLRAKTHSSWTGAAVASIWTSRLPSSHRVVEPGDSLHDDAETLFEVLGEQGYTTAAIVAGSHTSRTLGFDQGVTWFHQVGLSGLGESTALLSVVQRVVGESQVAPAAALDELRGFVDAQGDDRWCASVTLGAHGVEGYDARLTELDTALDGFFVELADDGRWDNTAVIVTADHGLELGEHGGEGQGATLYEELLHVPLVARWPGVEPGEVESQVRLVDVAPTLAGLGGAVAPLDWQGERLPTEGEARDRVAFAELSRHGVSLSSVQRGDWKLIKGPQRTELFELGLDPGETRNRAGEAGAIQAELERELVSLIKASTRQAAGASASDVDQVTQERLRALGYLE